MTSRSHGKPGWLTTSNLKESLATIDEIIAIDDKFKRSYVITQAYADLSWAIAELLPTPGSWPHSDRIAVPTDANFWSFLTWSARALTRNLRSTGPGLNNGGLRPAARARRFLTPLAMQALARGQEDAFSECARLGATFYHRMQSRRIKQRTVVNACLNELPNRLVSVRDERDLALGIGKLYDAVTVGRELESKRWPKKARKDYEAKLKERSELILTASIALDAAEQKLVQHPLEEAFHAIPNQLLGLEGGPAHSRNHRGRRRLTRAAARRLAPVLRDTSARLTTDWIFSVALPINGDEVVRLGRDLPLYRSGKRFPPALEEISDSDLQKLIRRFDDSFANGSGTAAKDWTIYDDRMSFIVNYLRLYQQQINPVAEPFESFQAARLRKGSYPWLQPGEDAQFFEDLGSLVGSHTNGGEK